MKVVINIRLNAYIVLLFTILALTMRAQAQIPGCSSCVSIWSASTTPAMVTANDTKAVELGVKFRSDVSGLIRGIRFYKSSSNTGTHIGNLWSASGTLLAKATFTNETASGWQQMNFATPVSITANTTYVASYFAPNGRWSANFHYFANSGVDKAPLHALSNAAAGGNGVYRYSSQSAFPNSSYGSTNYWVDIAFEPSGGAVTLSLAASPTSISFGNVALGNSSSQSVTLNNTGTGSVPFSRQPSRERASASAASPCL